MSYSPADVSGLIIRAATRAAEHFSRRKEGSVIGSINESDIQKKISAYDLEAGAPAVRVIDGLFDLLEDHSVRVDSPRYFGLFNPAPLPEAMVGEFIAAAVNPQLAVWSHAPAAVELERAAIRFMGDRVGWSPGETAGTFTSGGSEANHIALIAALAARNPDWATQGVTAVGKVPAIYASSEAHLAWLKIARMAGLGSGAVRLVEPKDGPGLTGQDVEHALRADRCANPVLIVATAGATAHGAIDDMKGIATIARECGAQFHVDAAWAGAALLSDPARRLLAGIEMADSITIDPHKWLSVPMGSGMYLSKCWEPLRRAFSVTTAYMPPGSENHRDPYLYTPQWSRRCIGLAFFTALASIGRTGYGGHIDRMIALGQMLKDRLNEDDWRVVNDSPLPVACFKPNMPNGHDEQIIGAIANALEVEGEVWISTTRVKNEMALRACITSYQTTEADVAHLIRKLAKARTCCSATQSPTL